MGGRDSALGTHVSVGVLMFSCYIHHTPYNWTHTCDSGSSRLLLTPATPTAFSTGLLAGLRAYISLRTFPINRG